MATAAEDNVRDMPRSVSLRAVGVNERREALTNYAASCRPHAPQYAAAGSLTALPHDQHAPGR